jgi:hypothetical protein
MTTQDDDEEPFDQRAYTAACVRTAFKRYRRTRAIKNAALTIVTLTAAVVPWLPDEVPWLSKLVELADSNILVWYVGILVVLLYGYTEQRLRTMQIRLATMHDLLHRIAGDDPEEQDELLMELVAEVGPVDPDPKLRPTASSRAEKRRAAEAGRKIREAETPIPSEARGKAASKTEGRGHARS